MKFNITPKKKVAPVFVAYICSALYVVIAVLIVISVVAILSKSYKYLYFSIPSVVLSTLFCFFVSRHYSWFLSASGTYEEGKLIYKCNGILLTAIKDVTEYTMLRIKLVEKKKGYVLVKGDGLVKEPMRNKKYTGKIKIYDMEDEDFIKLREEVFNG